VDTQIIYFREKLIKSFSKEVNFARPHHARGPADTWSEIQKSALVLETPYRRPLLPIRKANLVYRASGSQI
jgi:hypothetical protein